MGALVTANNDLIAGGAVAYSQDHKWGMDSIFRMWWALPIIIIILYIYWMVKRGLEKRAEDLYG